MSAQICYLKNIDQHPEIDVEQMPYAWLEAPHDAKLTWRHQDIPNWEEVAKWPQGRLFGEHAEYRWQTRPCGTLHIVLLVDKEAEPDYVTLLADNKPEALNDAVDAHLLLWGEWIDPEQDSYSNPDGSMKFYANEIPKILDYPLNPQIIGQQVPCLTIRRYRHEELGEFVRCVRVELQTLRSES